MNSKSVILLFFFALFSVSSRGQESEGKLALPKLKECQQRIRHVQWKGKWYFFSWEYEPTKDLEVTWFQARNICRRHCMDTVSLESDEENEFIKQRLVSGGKRYIWTSGRKCNFGGCDREDLQPVIINGWFWSASGVKLAPTDDASKGDWSTTGGAGNKQPDNREFEITSSNDEACLAVLNNFYSDGVVWHDIACHHKKYFVCEDNPTLLKYIEDTNPGVKLD